jgi:hypothetical protein
MNSLDKDDTERNKEKQAFDSPLLHEEEVENLSANDEAKKLSKEKEEAEENKEKTEVGTKEAFMRISSGSV